MPQTQNAEIELDHISTTYAQLANIVARTGRQLKNERVISSMQMMPNYKLLALLLVVASLAIANFDNQNVSGMDVLTRSRESASNRPEARAATEQKRVSTQAKNAPSNRFDWLDNYQAAIQESKATGKPIFLEFRCGP